MQVADQKNRFYATVFPSRPNSWEVDEVFELLAGLDEQKRDALLGHVGAIWPVSHSLCFAYLVSGVKAVGLFPVELLGEWVRQILGLYESKGLIGARQFMADVNGSFLGPMRGQAGVAFEEIAPTMMHYLRGISGRSFDFATAALPSTDTRTIYLPEFLDAFAGKETNVFLYKLLVSLQWEHVASRVFTRVLGPELRAKDPLADFPDRQLAADLLAILQFIRVFRRLEQELPGLIRRGRELCLSLVQGIVPGGLKNNKCLALQRLLREGIGTTIAEKKADSAADAENPARTGEPWNSDILCALAELYATISRLAGSYRLGSAALLLGEFDFAKAGETIKKQREEDRAKFVAMYSIYLEQQTAPLDKKEEKGNSSGELRDNLLLLVQQQQGEKTDGNKEARLLDNEGIDIPEELAALIRDIENDLGYLPEAYVQAASGQAGGGINRQAAGSEEEISCIIPSNVHRYDEWDYRRVGYRKDWCLLVEKSLQPVRSDFVAGTLTKYRPQLKKLRRQFEMLRTRDRYAKRRRDGHDIDLDALIEAMADRRSGRSPSDRLFIRLLRDERDIAAMFLVDMSNSTEGWVGLAVKEALVLLAEALEVVGDQYGIYGFSGMRRSRSELFHIKHLDEAYGSEVQARIAAIGPKEYTRMGPPIRHLSQKLLATQSTVRLLVVLSDGKPEDYDDYKGQYAIEDTRKALLEAQGFGIHPFCITIDKSAHDYLAHMFGRNNYIFVDQVLSLPAKMAEMYRLLTI